METFKQDLRRDLTRAMSASASPAYGLAFGFAGGLAAVFAFFLILFVFRPDMPARLNAWALGGEDTSMLASQDPVNGDAVGDPVHMNDMDSLYLRELLAGGQATAQQDEFFIENWYAEQANPYQVKHQVKQIEDEKIYAIRKFQMTNGQRVVVFTELGEDGSSYRQVGHENPVRTF